MVKYNIYTNRFGQRASVHRPVSRFKDHRKILIYRQLWLWTLFTCLLHPLFQWGCLGEGKVSCILRHQFVQLILTYSWARSDILAAGKGRGECFYFFCFFTFIHFSLSPLSLSFISYYLFYSLSLGDDTTCPHWLTVSLNSKTTNQKSFISEAPLIPITWPNMLTRQDIVK